LAEPGFDRGRFESRLATRRLGRALVVRERTGSTNDDVWEALASGAADGFTVVADVQTRGRGRVGRTWLTTPGKGLALSVLLRGGGESRVLGTTPLLAGLALARALDGLGVRTELKWPNDVLLHGRKLAGVLAESRSAAGDGSAAGRAVVIGVGVNVAEEEASFPPALQATATSLAREGRTLAREEVAAAFLNALEPLWDALENDGPAAVIEAWRARASFWGQTVRVRRPGGELAGIALGVDDQGRLLLALDSGETVTVAAGELDIAHPPAPEAARSSRG
jgi:BirA family biotin operon repressor/biotin-[acetyl-CoA-carboxylase] ligase